MEPTCYTQASRSPHWQQAMVEEFNSLIKQGNWTLVPPPPQVNTVGCKWVFKIKRHSDGRIDHYKARLVTKGYHQQAGLDYSNTFSPIVKPTTIHIIFNLVVSLGWPLCQLDVKMSFFMMLSLRKSICLNHSFSPSPYISTS